MKRSTWPLPRKRSRHRHDVCVVEAATHDHVDLDGREPGGGRRVDAREHAGGSGQSASFMWPNVGVVECVEADRDAVQPGVGERLARLAREQRGHWWSGRGLRSRGSARAARPDARAPGAAAARRRSAGPCRRPARRTRRATRAISSKLSSSARAQELVVGSEDLARHAVATAEVAAVGDRYPQVSHRPFERVEHTSNLAPAG